MNTKLISFFIGSLLPISISLFAQQSVSISSEKQQFIIGDPFSLKITITAGQEENIYFPSFKEILGENSFELLKTISSDTNSLHNGNRQITRELLLTSFEPGQYTLGPVRLAIKDEKISSDSISSNLIRVKVLPLPLKKDTATIKPIRDIWQENRNWQDWLPVFYTLAGLSLLVLFYIWFKRRKKISEPIPEPVKISPAQEALEKMNWLSNQNFLQEKDFVNYHYELGVIFRSFLEKQFEVKVLDLPMSEVLENIQSLPIKPMLTDEILSWMKLVDYVKFAKMEPSFSFHEEAFQQVKQFITKFLIKEGSMTAEKYN